jgi:hypothetical protein
MIPISYPKRNPPTPEANEISQLYIFIIAVTHVQEQESINLHNKTNLSQGKQRGERQIQLEGGEKSV